MSQNDSSSLLQHESVISASVLSSMHRSPFVILVDVICVEDRAGIVNVVLVSSFGNQQFRCYGYLPVGTRLLSEFNGRLEAMH